MSEYLIVGDGVAGDTAARKISSLNGDAEITVITDEELPFYHRPRLIEVLADKMELEEIIIHDRGWYEDKGIDLRMGEKIIGLDPIDQELKTDKGDIFSYRKLLLANGSVPFIPPIEGASREHVFTLRNHRDVLNIKELAQKVESVVVIGGGLLGLETAAALSEHDLSVTVLEVQPYILGNQLDEVGARLLQRKLESRGLEFKVGKICKQICGEERGRELIIGDGERLEFGLIVISAGVRPDLSLAEDGGLDTNRGIRVDKFLRTSEENIYAAGDVIEYGDRCYGIWPPAREQGEVAGANMVGENIEYTGSVDTYKLKVVGIDLVSIGEIDTEGKFRSHTELDEEQRIYRKIVTDRDDTVIGAILFGDISGFSEVVKAVKSGASLDTLEFMRS